MPQTNSKPIRIAFMGTPDFAVESAEALRGSGVEISAVVTAPDKAAGRGLHVRASAVKTWAQSHELPILQPDDLREPAFLEALKKLQADVFVVVAFRILPPEVFRLPKFGTVNLHASLLPKYRGAAPINWALIRGEKETGVTTFLIDENVDTGDYLMQKSIAIGENENFGELYERLKNIGSEVLVETVHKLVVGKLRPQKQHGEVTKAPKITQELRQVDWRQSAEDIRNLVRGLAPVPAAFTTLHGKTLKLFQCDARDASTDGSPGQVISSDRKNSVLEVHAGAKSSVLLQEVQLEGKKRMAVDAFLRGYPVEAGEIIGQR